jgi:4-aminobutyrate aminotransferase-like enzyme
VVQGVGGVVVPPDGYHQQVAALCRDNDISLIFDEVFTGFGRTGAWFASQHFGVVPDVMSIAKTVGGGVPLGGFVASDERAASFSPADHNTTFGANNVLAPVMGLKVLEIIERDGLVENARVRGEQLLHGFAELMETSPYIGEVRGKGLFLGVEIVEDKETRQPGPDIARRLRLYMQDHGIIVGVAGDAANVFKISPPLIINADQANHFLSVFGQALRAVN